MISSQAGPSLAVARQAMGAVPQGEAEVFHEFAHARDPFVVHLRGTWAMLAAWGQEEATCRCGLFHSAYTRDGFFFRYFDIRDDASRQALRDVVGAGAEAQIYNYCIGEAPWDEREYHSMGGHPAPPPAPGKFALGEPIDPAGYDVPSRLDPSVTVHYTPRDIAQMSVVFVADLIEQISTVSTYGDIYHELSPGVLWPGTGLPGMGFAFYSAQDLTLKGLTVRATGGDGILLQDASRNVHIKDCVFDNNCKHSASSVSESPVASLRK